MKTLELNQKVTLNQDGRNYDFVVRQINNGTYKLFNKFFLSRFWTIEEINSNLA
jgi:hypothetical protein